MPVELSYYASLKWRMPIWWAICHSEQKYMPFWDQARCPKKIKPPSGMVPRFRFFFQDSRIRVRERVVVACEIVLDLRLDFLSKRHKYSNFGKLHLLWRDLWLYKICSMLHSVPGPKTKNFDSLWKWTVQDWKSGRFMRFSEFIRFWPLLTVHFHLYRVYGPLKTFNKHKNLRKRLWPRDLYTFWNTNSHDQKNNRSDRFVFN